MKKGLVILLVVVGALVGAAAAGYFYVSGLKTKAVEHEQGLSATYESNQNGLSAFISAYHEQVAIAQLKTAKADTIMMHAVMGRYGEDGFSADGALFSALKEAYPDVDFLSIWDNLQTFIVAQRAAFKNQQDVLIERLRVYDTWRLAGFVRPWIIAKFSPSEQLVARIGGQETETGAEALKLMRRLVLNQDAVDAFQTGRMEPLTP